MPDGLEILAWYYRYIKMTLKEPSSVYCKPTTLEGVNQRVIELATTVDQEDEIIYSQLDDARPIISCRLAPSMDASIQTCSEGISLRTTVMAQQSEITELQAAKNVRIQSKISDLLKAELYGYRDS
ncbi:hypothetical protein Tco_1121298 [Tanacetum coccineum]|uniref:Uncharacterized protein n=1 Tax=Tanacetum coccineum TaxID=301880 RepID=A0ABQ5IXC3_9ASTR